MLSSPIYAGTDRKIYKHADLLFSESFVLGFHSIFFYFQEELKNKLDKSAIEGLGKISLMSFGAI